MLQNATTLKKSAPGPPNSSDEHVSCTAPATRNASFQILFKCPTPAIAFGNAAKPSRFAHFWQNLQKWSEHVVLCTFWLWNVLRATTACTFPASQLPKVVRTWCALYILTLKCASRHVHFLNISTSKSEMCFAPQRPAPFSTSQLLKVLRTWGVFIFFTCKCASRHNGVHFFGISTSKSGPNMVCFVRFDFEMCFAPQRRATFHLSSDHMAVDPPLKRAYFSTLRSHKSLEKHSLLRLSYLFAHLDLLSSETFSFLIFFLLLFSSLTLRISAFHLSILSEVWFLNFLRLCVQNISPSETTGFPYHTIHRTCCSGLGSQ